MVIYKFYKMRHQLVKVMAQKGSNLIFDVKVLNEFAKLSL